MRNAGSTGAHQKQRDAPGPAGRMAPGTRPPGPTGTRWARGNRDPPGPTSLSEASHKPLRGRTKAGCDPTQFSGCNRCHFVREQTEMVAIGLTPPPKNKKRTREGDCLRAAIVWTSGPKNREGGGGPRAAGPRVLRPTCSVGPRSGPGAPLAASSACPRVKTAAARPGPRDPALPPPPPCPELFPQSVRGRLPSPRQHRRAGGC